MVLLTIIAVSVFVVLYLVYSFLKRRPKNAPKYINIGLPFIGNYIGFLSCPVDFIAQALDKFGPIFTVSLVGKNITFLLGPEASGPFYSLTDDYMSQPEVYKFMTPVFGEGVVYDAEQKKRSMQYQTMSSGPDKHHCTVFSPCSISYI